MTQNSLPSANLNTNASNGTHWSWPKAIVTIFFLILGVALVLIGGSIFARYEMFDSVRGDVYGFFRQTVGMDKPTALVLGFGLGLIVIGVLWKSFWSLVFGRVTGTLLVLTGVGLLGYWGLSKYATAPMKPTSGANQNYAYVDGKCKFFDLDTTQDPETGNDVQPVTKKVLEACANRKKGKEPQEIDVSNPSKVEWFDRVLGYPAVFYVKRFNGQMAFFDAPGNDYVTGRPLEPVTAEIVQAVLAQKPIAPVASIESPPAIQTGAIPVSQTASKTLAVRSLTTPLVRQTPAIPEAPAAPAPALIHEAVLFVGDANNYAHDLIAQLRHEGVMQHAQVLPRSVSWPMTGIPDAAVLAAARNLGIGSVAVVSLQKEVKTSAELAGFTYAALNMNTRVFDTQSGRVILTTQSHGEGRAFDPSAAITQALASLNH